MLLRDEIYDQTTVLERVLRENRRLTLEAKRLLTSDGTTHAVIAARGTSDNAARYAKYVWGSRLGVPATLAAPSLYTRYRTPPDLKGATVVGISQSGQSPDLLAVSRTGGDRAGRQSRSSMIRARLSLSSPTW